MQLAGYTIKNIICAHNTTVVARAVDPLGNKVIIKYQNTDHPSIDLDIRWLHEFEVLQTIKSPYIVQAIELTRSHNSHILVLADFSSVPLTDLIKENKLRFVSRLQIACELVSALTDIHKHQLIHRDIAPKNILVDPINLTIKVCDFALASRLNKEQSHIRNTELWGTLDYISPELTGRTNLSVDYRSDYYSLGITLYELFSGQRPFNHDDPLALLHSHIARRPQSLHQLDDSIPEALSAIIDKLLAKSPDARYQSSFGLNKDLTNCLNEWQSNGFIKPFEIAHYDLAERFCISQKLYGRQEQLATLLKTFEQTTMGQTHLMLVSGFSGIGKSSLVKELHGPVIAKRGFFVSGKCDQYHRSQPYNSLIQAFNPLINQLLNEGPSRLAWWAKMIKQALGNNAAVITAIIPQLSEIIGDTPALQVLPPSEAEIRFHLTFNLFVKALSSNHSPLVIFLDDLQWADVSTLKLLQQQMISDNDDKENKALLVIAAFRDNEVQPGDPLDRTLQNIEQAQIPITRLHLTNLTIHDIVSWIQDSLPGNRQQVNDLAELCLTKTRGNPFFLNLFLTKLYANQDIRYQHDSGHWFCDINAVKNRDMTDNVIELMVDDIRKLAPETQHLLSFAAHLGDHFALWQLAAIVEQSVTLTAEQLWPALQAGLLIPQNEAYQFNQSPEKLKHACYRFLHDRVQQGAYSLINDQKRSHIRLIAGRQLLAQADDQQIEQLLFVILEQFSHAGHLITSKKERQRLLTLNIRGGIKAKNASAFTNAVTLLRFAQQLLPEHSWQSNPSETLTLYKELAEAEYLAGNFDHAEQIYRDVIPQVTDSWAINTLLLVQSDQYQLQGRFEASVAVLIQALKNYDVEIPTDEAQAKQQLTALFASTNAMLNQTNHLDLLAANEMQDPQQLLQMRLHVALIASIYFTGRLFAMGINACKMLTLSLTHGQSDLAPMAYISYLSLMARMGERYPQCYQVGKLAVEMAEHREDKYIRNAVYEYFSAAYQHWCEPLRSSFFYLDKSRSWGYEGINLMYSGYAIASLGMIKVIAGLNLSALETEIRQDLAFLNRTHQTATKGYTILNALMPVLALQGKTTSPWCFDTDQYLLDDFFHGDYQTPSMELTMLTSAMIRHSYLMGDTKQQNLYGQKLAMIETFMPDTPILVESRFYHTLSLLGVVASGEPLDETTRSEINLTISQFKEWSIDCYSNFHHKYLLLCAELARIENNPEQAIRYYDEAIDEAGKAGFIQCEALANELYAKFWLSKGQQRLTYTLIKDAHYLYQHWGALAKCRLIEDQWPNVTFQLIQAPFRQTVSIESDQANGYQDSHSTTTMQTQQLDLYSLLKANQLISQEIQLDLLLEKMMAILLENAGAEKGVIMMNNDGQIDVVITGKVVHHMNDKNDKNNGDGNHRPHDIDTKLINQSLIKVCDSSQPLLPDQLINYVQNNRTTLLLNNPAQDKRFDRNHYLQQHQPKSVICLPVIGQGKLIALVYLENNLTENAFTIEHQEILEVLGSQAAVSLINAQLYNSLEGKVKHRTEALRALALKDGLTEVANRRQFDDSLEKEWRRSLREKYSLALLMIDIDNFKPYNDHYGHPQGDLCIKSVAYTLDTCVHRASDLVARYGGEEFAILLPHCGIKEATLIAEKCLQAIRDLAIVHEYSDGHDRVTVSIGVCAMLPTIEQASVQLIKNADKALYAAKHNGRDQVQTAE